MYTRVKQIDKIRFVLHDTLTAAVLDVSTIKSINPCDFFSPVSHPKHVNEHKIFLVVFYPLKYLKKYNESDVLSTRAKVRRGFKLSSQRI